MLESTAQHPLIAESWFKVAPCINPEKEKKKPVEQPTTKSYKNNQACYWRRKSEQVLK